MVHDYGSSGLSFFCWRLKDSDRSISPRTGNHTTARKQPLDNNFPGPVVYNALRQLQCDNNHSTYTLLLKYRKKIAYICISEVSMNGYYMSIVSIH